MKTLSKGSLAWGLFGPLALLVGLGVAEIVNEALFTVQGFNFGLILFVGFMLWAWGVMAVTCDVLYDAEFVYLKGILNLTRVPLATVTNIYLINTSTTEAGRVYQHYIVRFNHPGIAHQSIKQRKGKDKMKMFAAAVKKVNAKVVIEHAL